MSAEYRNNLGRIFLREKTGLLTYIRQRVDRIEDAEDILQDVFYHTLRGYSITEPIENLAGWLYVSARNRITDWYRGKSRRIIRLINPETEPSLHALIWESGLNPEKQYVRKRILNAVTEALGRLPENQRRVILWQMIEGRTFHEISGMTGESVNTLISRKRYALESLRKKLKHLKDELE
ncbi:MAG TPA: sigma-70 family RNA polymerase sigma factor [bacterium]|nr:sigma-70 family RNA polymerase sigma factor [bacterium]